MQRYSVGFKSESIKSDITERMPKWFPIVDNATLFGSGIVVALCENEAIAHRICRLLNAAEPG